MQNGKGSKPRPIKDINIYINNWNQINWSKKSKVKSTFKPLIKLQKENK